MKKLILLSLLACASVAQSASNVLTANKLMFHSIVSDGAKQELADRYPEYTDMLYYPDVLLLLNFLNTTQKPVIIKFSADWCAPCRRLMPIVHELANTYAQHVIVIEVNFDEDDALREMFDVTAIPTLIYFKNGIQVDRTFSVSKEMLDYKIKTLLE